MRNRISLLRLAIVLAGILLILPLSFQETVLAGSTPNKDCSRTSVGLTPLTDMTAEQDYHGQTGGLYGNGLNELPSDHPHLLKARQAAAQIYPRDANGDFTENGKIGLVTLGMSNTSYESNTFISLANSTGSGKSNSVVVVNGAKPGADSKTWVNPPDPTYTPWDNFADKISAAGLVPAQVQVVWVKLTIANPSTANTFPIFSENLRDDMAYIVKKLKSDYPFIQVIYLSSRIYGGYSLNKLSPEPFAYEGAFSNRWLIEDQINGGGVTGVTYGNAPVLLWGPYLWADGMTGRSDGLVYLCDDFTNDGVHPDTGAREKVASMLLSFFKTDPLASPWFTGSASLPDQVAQPSVSPNGGTFTSPIEVTLSSTTYGAQVRYTLDGSDPGLDTFLYEKPFQIGSEGLTTLKARAFKEGLQDSPISSATFYLSTGSAVGGPEDYVAYWKFDEGSGAIAGDISGNGNTLSLAGDPAWQEGYRLSSLHLDGVDDYSYRNDADLSGPFPAESTNPAQNFTLSAWLRLDSTGRRHPILTKEGFKAPGFDFYIDSDNKLYLEVFSGNWTSTLLASENTLVANTWYHLVATFEYLGSTSSVIHLFINGTEVGYTNQAVGPLKINTQPLEIGRYAWKNWYTKGTIDEVRLYSRALSAAEVAAITWGDSGAPTQTPTPVGISTSTPTSTLPASKETQTPTPAFTFTPGPAVDTGTPTPTPTFTPTPAFTLTPTPTPGSDLIDLPGTLSITLKNNESIGTTYNYTYTEPDWTTTLTGAIFKPAGAGPFPGLLISHGKGGSAYTFSLSKAKAWFADYLSISPNYTHAGGNLGGGGDPGGSPENVKRAIKSLDILQSQELAGIIGDFLEKDRLYMYGNSMGGFVTIETASVVGDRVAGAAYTASGLLDPYTPSGPGAAASVEAPFLLLQGEKDGTVPPESSRSWADALASYDKVYQLVWFPEGGHNINADPATTDQVRDFIRAWFSSAPPLIQGVAPAVAEPGQSILVNGERFGGNINDNSRILVGGLASPIEAWSDTAIGALIPLGATSGPVFVIVPVGPITDPVVRQPVEGGQRSNAYPITIQTSNTPSPTPTRLTGTPTSTPLTEIPTSTATFTGTPTPAAFTDTPTPTAVFDTPTPTAFIDTPTPTATYTSAPTFTFTPTPTVTFTPTPTPTGVITASPADYAAYWQFEEGSGLLALDESSSGNNLSLQNGASWELGYLGGGIRLDGVGSHLLRNDADLVGAFPAASVGGAQHFTLSAWIKLDVTGMYQPVFTKEGLRARGFDFYVGSDDRLHLEIFSGNWVSTIAQANTAMNANVWYHVSVTYDYIGSNNSAIRFYLDGIEDGGTDGAVGPVMTNTQPLMLGRYDWMKWNFDGVIDEARVYARVLSPSEIAALAGR